MKRWKMFPNAARIQAGIQVSFFELAYDPTCTTENMRAGDELIVTAPDGVNFTGSIAAIDDQQITIKDAAGTEWILTPTSDAERQKCLIYPDMLNAIWTIRHRRLG